MPDEIRFPLRSVPGSDDEIVTDDPDLPTATVTVNVNGEPVEGSVEEFVESPYRDGELLSVDVLVDGQPYESRPCRHVDGWITSATPTTDDSGTRMTIAVRCSSCGQIGMFDRRNVWLSSDGSELTIGILA